MKTYYVYIVASKLRVLYIGVTSNLEERVWQHKQKKMPGFTQKYNCDQLVFFEAFGDVRAAIAREKELKGWRREKKLNLIEAMNPAWKDLSAPWFAKVPMAKGRERTKGNAGAMQQNNLGVTKKGNPA